MKRRMAQYHGKQIKRSKIWPKYINLKRKEKVVLNRLRIGHTKFSHGHL